MAKIKKLEMQGFKSFAKKTEIPVPSGFNCICGPNGSGKSNIIDAITFVLGTLSTKQIRAGKLEDLIFKGSEKKSARDEAKVSLVFDNEDQEIPVEEDEVKVTRKVNDKGNSVYKMNGKTVTRRKITDTLSSARIYADGHNIIMQGAITQFIEMSPIERREIIDEASGIEEFDQKKEDTERELEKVESKLKEARLILGEKKKSIEKLEEEKKLVEKRERIEEDLNRIKAKIAKTRFEKVEGEKEEVEEELEKIEEEVEEAEEKLDEKDEELEEVNDELDEIQEDIVDESQDKDLIREIESVKSKIESKKEKIEDKREELGRIDDSIEKFKKMEKRQQQISGKGPAKSILKLDKDGVHGTIQTLGKVEEKYQKALGIAAGGNMNSVVTKNDRVAQDCIQYLKNNKIGRATFLPLNKMKPWNKSRQAKKLKDKPGVIDFAINLIDYDSKYELAFQYVFKDTLIVENLDVARRHSDKARMVTLDGDIVYKSGAMKGGHNKSKSDFGSFQSDKSSEIEGMKEEREKVEEKIDILRSEIGQLSDKLDELREREDESETEITGLENKKEDLKEKQNRLQDERRDLYEKKVQKREKLNKLNVRKAKIDSEYENAKTELEKLEDLEEVDLEEVKAEDEDKIGALKDEKRDLRRKLEGIGPVNFKAKEEYKSAKQVYDDLKKRVDKIQDEKEAIEGTIEEIEKRRRNTFMEAFNEINENFQEIFQELYGHEGEIKLEDEDDIKSGLLVEAKTSNKKKLSLDSMSGGEKTLTALAFLFSVQLYEPAPFYILDEVDAALDQKNSQKVADLINHYSEDAQFIVITHNDQTLQKADYVYGVSMDGGVSEVMALEMPEE
ncbi:MAG: chromosome segregation SMC family protein [Candidatus Aenigmatarchaeota archaeon]